MTLTMTSELPRVTHTRREDTIKEMLSTYDDAKSVSSGEGGTGGRAESRYHEFDPTTWTREYQELERVLDRLKWLAYHGRPMIARNVNSYRGWWNLDQRYFKCEKIRRPIHLRKTRSGDRIPVGLPRNMAIASRTTILNGSQSEVYVWVWDPRVDLGVVDATIAWISKEFGGSPAVFRESD